MNKHLELIDTRIGLNDTLISDINTSPENGKLIVLSGVNGSGKSTLLRSIAGIIPVLGGDIRVSGRSITHMDHRERSLNLAFAGTSRIKEEYIRIIDLIRFGRYPYLRIKAMDHEHDLQTENAIELMGLKGISEKYLNNVSDGEWQKANIARAIAQATPVILLDEPSAFLDYPSKSKLFKDLKQICTSLQKTILVSTHDMESAAASADIFWHISDKKIRESSSAPDWQLTL